MSCEKKKKQEQKPASETLTNEKLEQVNGGDAFNDLPRMDDKEIDESLTDRA